MPPNFDEETRKLCNVSEFEIDDEFVEKLCPAAFKTFLVNLAADKSPAVRIFLSCLLWLILSAASSFFTQGTRFQILSQTFRC